MSLLSLLFFVPVPLPLPQDDAAATAAELRAHVKFLASDALEGRRAGTVSADYSAWFLAGALDAAGFQPAGEGDSWYQPFLIDMPPDPGACNLTLHGPSGDVLETWDDLGTLQLSATTSVDAPVVAAGYGMVVDHGGMVVNEYTDAGAEGKVVLVRRYTEFGPEADPQFAALGNLRDKVRNAAEAGAVGIILGTHPDDVAGGGDAVIAFDAAPGTMPIPVVTVDPEQFRKLEGLLEGDGPALTRCTLAAEVVRRKAETSNVLGILPGRSDEILVLGAHYDHLGWGGQGSLAPGVREIHNGADDNASGTAVLMELAEALAQGARASGQPPARTILVAFWGAEEEGLLGSTHWMRQPTVDLGDVLCNLNLDMVGRLEGGAITVGSHWTAQAFGPALAAAADAVPGLELKLTEEGSPTTGGSDHMAFHQEEIPAMFFFAGLHSDYSKPSDDWETLDYDRMSLLCDQVLVVVDELSVTDRSLFDWVPPEVDPDAERRSVAGARAWFGSIPDYAASPEGGGLQIAGTSPGGPAEAAGLMKADVIKRVGDVAVTDIYDFMDSLAKYVPGDVVEVDVLRDGEILTLPVTLSARSSGD